MFKNIQTDNITDLNELIYAGAKLVFDKTAISKGTRTEMHNLYKKSGLKDGVKKLRQGAKLSSKEKYVRLCWDEKSKIKQQKSPRM